MDWLKRENPLCIKTKAAARISQILFVITYVVYIFARVMADTTYRYEYSTEIFSQIAWICCFLALLNIIFLCRYSVGQLLGIVAFLGLYLFLWFHIQRSDCVFLQSMFIVFSCSNMKWDHVLRISFGLQFTVILVPAILEWIGILPGVEVYRGSTMRYTLGFSHPNVLGGHCLCLVIIWMLIRYKKLKIYDYVAWILIAIFLWIVPNSKTSTFLVLLICLMVFVFKRLGKNALRNPIVQSVCLSFGWIMAFFSILASYLYDKSSALYVWIDKTLFTTRLSCAHTFLNEYPITIFGQKLEFVDSVTAADIGVRSRILDNFYVRQLLQFGVISLFIVLAIFTFLLYRAIRIKNQAMLIGLIVILIYCVYENRGVNLVYNVLLFQIVYQILSRKEISDG